MDLFSGGESQDEKRDGDDERRDGEEKREKHDPKVHSFSSSRYIDLCYGSHKAAEREF